ncbi:hypothetical protein [Cloacibacillus evryensis]|uniref:Uncharacterized protein n=1 Tax=Cloacibacillus evryensis TaxID=508460 RepID=A0AAW5K4M7_9BACT|nr:hypothetical protein [Cloacibacillus evryensis]EXG78608.1 hypothetical protein Cloev_0736 [Cloacibacillus evryensis DSM 19522]MCQ4814821.1 hypothetical protein [Cloacibacillus evryensis]MEA5035556.1 hypothetical protein [Cloacibacillus evryensis]
MSYIPRNLQVMWLLFTLFCCIPAILAYCGKTICERNQKRRIAKKLAQRGIRIDG